MYFFTVNQYFTEELVDSIVVICVSVVSEHHIQLMVCLGSCC